MLKHTEFLLDLIQGKKVSRGAEVGVFKGDMTIDMLWHLREHLCQYICVDLWLHYPDFFRSTPRKTGMVARANMAETKSFFLSRVSHYIKRGVVVVLDDDSLEASRLVEDESLDFVFIDGNHAYNYVFGDIISWSRKVKPDGLIAGHDYVEKPGYGVIAAVKEIFDTAFSVDKRSTVWYTFKKEWQNDCVGGWDAPKRDICCGRSVASEWDYNGERERLLSSPNV